MELKSSISSVFLHAGKHLKPSPNIMPHTVPLLLTGNSAFTIEAAKTTIISLILQDNR
jgi:hypothetical protein